MFESRKKEEKQINGRAKKYMYLHVYPRAWLLMHLCFCIFAKISFESSNKTMILNLD